MGANDAIYFRLRNQTLRGRFLQPVIFLQFVLPYRQRHRSLLSGIFNFTESQRVGRYREKLAFHPSDYPQLNEKPRLNFYNARAFTPSGRSSGSVHAAPLEKAVFRGSENQGATASGITHRGRRTDACIQACIMGRSGGPPFMFAKDHHHFSSFFLPTNASILPDHTSFSPAPLAHENSDYPFRNVHSHPNRLPCILSRALCLPKIVTTIPPLVESRSSRCGVARRSPSRSR
ncbi:hypothetical protein Hypma_003516 [Hypsizygus marmoreus]|uniref:Uncharacterized protein n=1 Tax=Hypsizygus marmoreus TaxID=39966 RepID=A0A369J6E7_HYPMA|nr:hypothetical protein Hypma_003516 [Hypsizygus marmoreus]